MAKLKSHGTELLRTVLEREFTKEQNDLCSWERTEHAYMADGQILQKHDVRFHEHPYDSGFHSYGWKLWKRLRKDATVSMERFVAEHRAKMEAPTYTGPWKVIGGSSRPPVVISPKRIMQAVESGDMNGFCLACGEEAYGVEPDARNYKCETCGQNQVYGAEELALQL